MERKVKGSLVKLMVKPIRANKTGAYDNILSDKAKVFINQRILDSIFYPYDIYKEIYNAVSKVEANDNPEVLIRWGHEYGEFIFTSIYKLQVGHGDIKNTIEKYKRFHKLVFNFSEIEGEVISNNQAIISFKDFERDWENFYHLALGWIQKFIELSLKKKVQAKITQKSWEGAEKTQFLLTWSLNI